MFQILCSKTKNSKKNISIVFLKHFLNAMIRNIKIHHIFYIIELLESMEPNKFISKKI
jgi:hypothetical protein